MGTYRPPPLQLAQADEATQRALGPCLRYPVLCRLVRGMVAHSEQQVGQQPAGGVCECRPAWPRPTCRL